MPESFHIVPASGRALAFLAGMGAMLLGLTGLFAYFGYASLTARFEISEERLRIRSAIYGRTIPIRELLPENARIVDLQTDREFRPTMRTNGIGIPGYRAGWFRVRQGKALLFITDPTRAVYLPTRMGYSLLLSVQDPEGFLQALRNAAGHDPG